MVWGKEEEAKSVNIGLGVEKGRETIRSERLFAGEGCMYHTVSSLSGPSVQEKAFCISRAGKSQPDVIIFVFFLKFQIERKVK